MVHQGEGVPFSHDFMGGKVTSGLFALPPVLPRSKVEPLGLPLVVVLLAVPLILLGAGSLECKSLILKFVGIIIPSD